MANGQADQSASLSLSGFEQSISIRSDQYGKAMEENSLEYGVEWDGETQPQSWVLIFSLLLPHCPGFMLGDILWLPCPLGPSRFLLEWKVPCQSYGPLLGSCCPVLLICIVPHLLTSYNGSNLHVALHMICITLGHPALQ